MGLTPAAVWNPRAPLSVERSVSHLFLFAAFNMTPETVLTIFQQAMEVIVALILVVLLPALGVGLLVAMFQAATQINEMTLSFIPKILVTLAVLMMAGPWMLGVLLDFTRRLIENVPVLIG